MAMLGFGFGFGLGLGVGLGVRVGAAPSEIFFCRSMIVISRSFTWGGKQRGMAGGE